MFPPRSPPSSHRGCEGGGDAAAEELLQGMGKGRGDTLFSAVSVVLVPSVVFLRNILSSCERLVGGNVVGLYESVFHTG